MVVLKLPDNLNDTFLLCQHSQYQDVTIVCKNGKISVNSFLFAAIFPEIRNLAEIQVLETIFLPDIPRQDLENLFSSIYEKKRKIVVPNLFSECETSKVDCKTEICHEDQILLDEIHEDDTVDYDQSREELKEELHEDTDISDEKETPVNISIKCQEGTQPRKLSITSRMFPFKCHHCGDTVNPTPVGPEKAYFCTKCDKRISEFLCSKCDYKSHKRYNVSRHMVQVHTGNKPHKPKQNTKPDQNKKKRKNIKRPDTTVCSLCGFSGKSKKNLIAHMKRMHIEHIEDQEKCLTCGKAVWVEDMAEHQCKNYSCHVCGKITYNPSSFKLHMKMVHGECVCELCGKELSSEYDMKEHLATVHFQPMETFDCDVCDSRFYSATKLRLHKRYHVEKTDCTICNKKVRNLEVHTALVHKSDDERKFQCKICGKGFMSQCAINKHEMNVHLKLNSYECRYGCSNRYSDNYNRDAHERKTHGQVYSKD